MSTHAPAAASAEGLATSRPRLGLVLGGGGPAAALFHAVALSRLQEEVGWNPNDSHVVVGTSAGALVGMMIRLGVEAPDLVNFQLGRPELASHPLIRNGTVADPPGFEGIPMLWRLFRRGIPDYVRSIPRDGFGPLLELLSGDLEFLPYLDFVTDEWPDRRLVACAGEARTRLLATWDRSGRVKLADAVAASCSVPGMFSTVEIDGETYVDGGLRSPTNADVMTDEPVDHVLVLSPLTAANAGILEALVANPVALWARRRLSQEVRRLEESGKQVTVLGAPVSVLAASRIPSLKADRGAILLEDTESLVNQRMGALLPAVHV